MWTILGVIVAIDAGAVVLGILDRHVQSLAATIMFTSTTIGFAIFGALIVWRHRAHSIGWLFVAVAFFFAFCHNLAQNYAVYTLAVDPGSLPAGKAVFWLASTALDTFYVGAMLLLLLLFPDGRPLTPRWRPLVAVAILAMLLGMARREAVHERAAAPGGAQPACALRGRGDRHRHRAGGWTSR